MNNNIFILVQLVYAFKQYYGENVLYEVLLYISVGTVYVA